MPDRLRARLPDLAHTSQPWRIHALTPDFRLEDVWALPVCGRRNEFSTLVAALADGDPADSPSRLARALWGIRWKLGELLGWDRPEAGVGSRVESLRDRLPSDLRDRPGPKFEGAPFEPLYLLEDEFAAELANRTVHGVLHLGWVESGDGTYRGQMAVLVKPNGVLGRAYLLAIKPFRYLVVYPALLKQIERNWRR